MKYTELELFDTIFYSYTTGLQGRQFSFEFLWLEGRDTGWIVNIKDEVGLSIISGYKLVQEYPMMADYALEDRGLSGYFLLLPKIVGLKGLNKSPSEIAQFYRLFYIY